MVRFKARLRMVVRDTPHRSSSQEEFAVAMKHAGCEVTQGTISNWLSPKLTNLPNAFHLWIIAQMRKDISVEWLIGLRGPSSKAELYIEDEVSKEFGALN